MKSIFHRVFVLQILTYLSAKNIVRLSSEYVICHFQFLWPKILRIIFAPKTIPCSRLCSDFYWFYLWCCVFRVLHYQFLIIIFPKLLVVWLVVEFFVFFFHSLFSSFNSFISASFSNFSFISFSNFSFSSLSFSFSFFNFFSSFFIFLFLNSSIT